MENTNSPERSVIQYVRSSRAFRQFKNPPQPHMCIQDTLKDTTEKMFINVLGWQKIANPKQYSDPIPLYGGMQVPQGCGPNSNKPPLLVFAVMVNPDILKANGKNATNPTDRDALVNLLCDFVEAMNPGLALARKPVILRDRDLAGELKDVWLAVQKKRDKEKEGNQEVMYKVYDIDGVGNDEVNDDERQANLRYNQGDGGSPTKVQNNRKNAVKSSKQILMNAGQKSEFDLGMNNCQLNQNHSNRDNKCATDTTYCTPVYEQIVSYSENHNQINDIQEKFTKHDANASTSFTAEWDALHGKPSDGWEDFSKRNINSIKSNEADTRQRCSKTENGKLVNKTQYNFFPVFNKTEADSSIDNVSNEQNLRIEEKAKIILDPMQKLVLHSTDNKICDNNSSALSSLSS
uniref:Odorant receptor n=1 Tax=Histia rhodope TaxID=1453155 RepID=A0A7G4KBW7_9NEOP|nr:odorant receptor [Histia rhodope]